MKKKYVCLMFASLFAASFCGCYNMRTDPNESLDKVTFCEWCEHYLLFAHDCRRSREKCIPICIEDCKRFDRNLAEEQEKWKAFKNMEPYRPRRTGIVLMDQINRTLANITEQIRYEVVIPYKELDKQGHIQAYKVFRADMNQVMAAFKVDRKTAIQWTYTRWKNHYGEERCQQLMAAFPIIENMRADRQLGRALARNADKIQDLILYIPQAERQLRAEAKNSVAGIAKITCASIQTSCIAAQLAATLDYLGEFLKEKSQEERDIRVAIEDIQKHNNKGI